MSQQPQRPTPSSQFSIITSNENNDSPIPHFSVTSEAHSLISCDSFRSGHVSGNNAAPHNRPTNSNTVPSSPTPTSNTHTSSGNTARHNLSWAPDCHNWPTAPPGSAHPSDVDHFVNIHATAPPSGQQSSEPVSELRRPTNDPAEDIFRYDILRKGQKVAFMEYPPTPAIVPAEPGGPQWVSNLWKTVIT